MQQHVYSGRAIGVAVWNVALSEDDIAALSAGVDPRVIQPKHLQSWAPRHQGLVVDECRDVPTATCQDGVHVRQFEAGPCLLCGHTK